MPYKSVPYNLSEKCFSSWPVPQASGHKVVSGAREQDLSCSIFTSEVLSSDSFWSLQNVLQFAACDLNSYLNVLWFRSGSKPSLAPYLQLKTFPQFQLGLSNSPSDCCPGQQLCPHSFILAFTQQTLSCSFIQLGSYLHWHMFLQLSSLLLLRRFTSSASSWGLRPHHSNFKVLRQRFGNKSSAGPYR